MGKENGIKDVLTAMFESASKEQLAKANPERVAEIAKFLHEEDVTNADFYLFDSLRTDREIVQSITQSQDATFLVMNIVFIEFQLEGIIKKFEGSACSADKSSWILSLLYNYFINGKEIVFTDNYWCPSIAFTNQQDLLDVFDAISRLYYGNIDLMLEVYKKIISRVEASNE